MEQEYHNEYKCLCETCRRARGEMRAYGHFAPEPEDGPTPAERMTKEEREELLRALF